MQKSKFWFKHNARRTPYFRNYNGAETVLKQHQERSKSQFCTVVVTGVHYYFAQSMFIIIFHLKNSFGVKIWTAIFNTNCEIYDWRKHLIIPVVMILRNEILVHVQLIPLL